LRQGGSERGIVSSGVVPESSTSVDVFDQVDARLGAIGAVVETQIEKRGLGGDGL
jgi:hypothetical protein